MVNKIINTDSRYSRLKAIKEFGFDINFEDLDSKHVFVVGVGGLGSLSSEMLVRAGVGKLSIIDLDIVEEANLNRMFYTPLDIGKSKVEVADKQLSKLNSDCTIDSYHQDLLALGFEQKLESIINNADLILNGLDNVSARQYLNIKIIKAKKPMIDAGATRSGLGGYVHLIKPGFTACYACTGSVKPKRHDARGPRCNASLPTTMAIIASLQTQQAYKILLNFGKIPDYIQYNALNDSFLEFTMARDENCYVCGKKPAPNPFSAAMSDEEELETLLRKAKEQENAIKKAEKQ